MEILKSARRALMGLTRALGLSAKPRSPTRKAARVAPAPNTPAVTPVTPAVIPTQVAGKKMRARNLGRLNFYKPKASRSKSRRSKPRRS